MSQTIDETLSTLNHSNSFDPFDELRSDETYKHFLSDSFDSQTISSMHGMTINEQIIKITNGIEILNKNLNSLVCDKYEDLLAQSTKIETLEDVLKVIQTKIQSLLTALERIRAKLVEPYNRILQQMVLLNRLQSTCDLLRRTIRIIHLGKRLEQSKLEETEPTLLIREIIKVAQYINEIESILSDDSNDLLKKIQTIENDIKLAKSIKITVLKEANDILINGLAKQDNNYISAALQVFYSLKMLNQKVEQITIEKQDYISNAIKEAIDVTIMNQNKSITGPGRVVIPMTIGQNVSFRSTLRNNIDTLLENIYSAFSQMSSIYKIIKKKRDPLTHICFIDDLENKDGLNEFWSHVTKSLSEQLCKAANDSIILKQALEGEYPKLLSSFSELWKRIARDDKDINAEKVLRLSMQPFESAYLSRSLSLLFDSVNKVFADAKETSLTSVTSGNMSSNAPSNEDIEAIVKHITNELHVSSVDPVLCKSVAKNVSKTINLFVVKCEQLTSVDGDSTQVIGPLTNSQLLNATIVHRLESFRIQMNNLLASSACSVEGIKIVEESLTSIETLMTNTITPIMSSVIDSIEAIMLTMHSENYNRFLFYHFFLFSILETSLFFNSQSELTDSQCSGYMRELQGFIARVTNVYFKQLPDCEVMRNRFELFSLFKFIHLFNSSLFS
jgi:hypothetical protein